MLFLVANGARAELVTVDFGEVLLNVGGWIVAGLVTLGGVLVAHWVEVRGRQRQEDRVSTYEPLRREMVQILEREYLVKSGYSVWTQSDGFKEILQRGLLHPKRHDSLRSDVDELLRLNQKHEATYSDFYDKRKEALDAMVAITDYEISGQRAKLSKVLGHNFSDDQMFQAIAADDKELFLAQFNERIRGASHNLGSSIELAVPPQELYEKIMNSVGKSRKAFVATSKDFIDKTRTILANLDDSLASGSRYRQSK